VRERRTSGKWKERTARERGTTDGAASDRERAANARGVTLRSRADSHAKATFEEAMSEPSTPPKREATVEEMEEEREDARATEAALRLVDVYEKKPAVVPARLIDENTPAAKLRKRGNEAMDCGDYALAHALYAEALDAAGEDVNVRSVLFCNRALAYHKMGEYEAAMCDAKCAEELAPRWSKPKRRLAEACARLGSYSLAVAYARLGEKLELEEKNFSKSFRDLLDEIAIAAAEDGSVAGFDGRLIYVRSAGEEAWLGGQAPMNAAFDELEEEAVDPMFATGANPANGLARPIHARSLRDAVRMAHDGDRILLLRGVHNGLGEVVDIDKRVLIRGEGTLRDASVDCRNNSPLFRIKRSCVIQNLDIDFTGFCESTRIIGDARVKPLLENCVFVSSGGDGLALGGKASPTFRNCVITGKKSGVRAYAQAAPTFIDCNITASELQGVLAMKETRVILQGCAVQANKEDGVVAMESANVVMTKCLVQDNLGPGVDVSEKAKVVLNQCEIDANVGGLWLWDDAVAHASECIMNGGRSHAILVDVDARAHCRSCDILGVVHASEAAGAGVRGPGTVIRDIAVPTTLPRELKGAFKFDPCAYTRKQ